MFKKLLYRYDSFTPSQASTDAYNAGKSTGENAINSFNPQQVAGTQQQNTNNLFDTQQNQTQNYINQYAQAVKNNPTVTNLYSQGNELYNVEPLQSQVNYLQNQVTNAVPGGYQAARNFDIDNTDIQNGIASKLAYINPQLNAAENNLTSAQQLAQGFVNAGIQQNQQNLLPIQAEQQNLLQEQAAQATGWNQAAQQEFQGYINKMNAGVTLSQAEITRATELAKMEESYQQAQMTANLANKYVPLSPSQTLVNTFTGKTYNPITGSQPLTLGLATSMGGK